MSLADKDRIFTNIYGAHDFGLEGARKRGDETHAFDPAVTDAWYESLRGADGVGIIRGIVGNIVGGPLT